jgi:predicted Zn-dependent peptidase
VEQAFGDMPRGAPNLVPAAGYVGGLRSKAQDGSSQTHLVLGFPLPTLREDDPAGTLAAAVLGEGMSSPLLDSLRERKGLAYYSACSADVLEMCGQFVIEASTAPEQLDELVAEILVLLERQAERVAPVDLERAQHQLAVRRLHQRERPMRVLEDAALDWFALGRVRGAGERDARLRALGAADARAAFERMLAAPVALAVTGQVRRGTRERLSRLVERHLGPARAR